MEPDMIAADDTLRLWDVNSRGWTNLGLARRMAREPSLAR
jgi:hypothetical protein